MPLVASAVWQQALSPPKKLGIQEKKRPLAGPTRMPASMAAWKEARHLCVTRLLP